VTALHQSSGGILRKAGFLARGAMLAAAQERCPVVTAEHVRIATTETFKPNPGSRTDPGAWLICQRNVRGRKA